MHLKHFVGQSPPNKIWVYDAKESTKWSSGVSDAGLQNHFYSVPLPDGGWDTEVERNLAKVETGAAPIYEALLKGEFPRTSEQRSNFSTFLALMVLRTTVTRRRVAEAQSRRLQTKLYKKAVDRVQFAQLIASANAAGDIDVSPEMTEPVRQAMMNPSRFIFTIPHFYTLQAFEQVNRFASIFFEMHWMVVNASQGFFITCDNPVLIVERRATPSGTRSLRDPATLVQFPLSPELMLCLSWTLNAPARGSVKRSDVDSANQLLAEQSERFLYSHLEHKEVFRLLKLVGSQYRQLPSTDSGGPRVFGQTIIGKGR
jgi:hypothetical protein